MSALSTAVADPRAGTDVAPWSTPFGRTELSSCEQDVLEVLSEALQRLPTRKILNTLRRQGRNRSLSAVKRALACLVAKGVIRSSRRKPFGYVLAGELPSEPAFQHDLGVVDVLREVGFRMTGNVLMAALAERGNLWSPRQLEAELDRLLAAAEIDCDPNVRPAGFGLPEWHQPVSPQVVTQHFGRFTFSARF
jgi:hypothetical protein